MKILPSILEYSIESLQSKLSFVNGNLSEFKNLTKCPEFINLHLDFVMENFAKDRKVMKSLNPQTVLQVVQKNFNPEDSLSLSLHIMGEMLDLKNFWNYIQNFEFNKYKKWNFSIFVPESFWEFFTNLKEDNLSWGIWYDLNQWNTKSMTNLIASNFLLMTVLAGKSGQKLSPEIAQKALEIVEKNPNCNFILDGGWSIDFQSELKNLELVSYSSFWNTFKL